MQPSFDAASSLSTTSAEGSLEHQQRFVHGAASSSPPRGTRASAGGGIIRCQDCWLLAKADGCAHRRCRTCCTGRGLVCPTHVTPSSHFPTSPPPPAAAAALTRKRPRPLDSVATSSTTSSSVGQPAAAPEGFAREVSMGAVFRRVRLGPDGAAEVAYHATVTIGGHAFRGVLYDVGPRGRRRRGAASTDTGGSSGVSSASQSSAAAGGGLDLTLRL
ncbi:unnamed protein product [Urochloa humidicola]